MLFCYPHSVNPGKSRDILNTQKMHRKLFRRCVERFRWESEISLFRFQKYCMRNWHGLPPVDCDWLPARLAVFAFQLKPVSVGIAWLKKLLRCGVCLTIWLQKYGTTDCIPAWSASTTRNRGSERSLRTTFDTFPSVNKYSWISYHDLGFSLKNSATSWNLDKILESSLWYISEYSFRIFWNSKESYQEIREMTCI